MAALQNRNGSFRILFRYEGSQHTLLVGKVPTDEAQAFLGKVEHLLLRIQQRWVQVPAGVAITDFLLADGQVKSPEKVIAPAEPIIFQTFKGRYLEAHSHGAMEANSLATVRMHLGHFERTLGERFVLQKLTLADLQRHVNRRARKQYRGKALSPVTLRKETATFRAAWNWAMANDLVEGPFPSRGLVYPKTDEKPPFMTWQEIERKVTASGLSDKTRSDLWDSLYLRKEEIDELLTFVKAQASHPWIYPLFCAAAHTGARRSELLRAEVSDIDLEGGILLIREKKRSRKQRTTRHVSLSPFLKEVLREWQAVHPGGQYLFCQAGEVGRSKKRSRSTGYKSEGKRAKGSKQRLQGVRRRETPGVAAVTRDEAHDHFRRTLAGSKWEVLRGYHVLRHSFISCLAAAGIDQRIIDEFSGHSTEEQRRRYRHLVPNIKQQAVQTVFG
ncbi:MAG: tyrosine-type recombinase/integrase [Gemmataceae bacterium]